MPPTHEDGRAVTSSGQTGRIFVGRKREMGELRAAMEESMAGRGRLVMLLGEPGIGKTRTAQELVSHAQGRGAQVYWGRCYDESGAPPYWPWVQAIRDYVQQATPGRLQAEIGPGAADIAVIVPDIDAKLPSLPLPPALEPEQARFRLFDSIPTFLKTPPAHSQWCWSWTTSTGPTSHLCCCCGSWRNNS